MLITKRIGRSIIASVFALGVLQNANAGLVNGSFESPVFNPGGNPGVTIQDASVITGWNTTATDNKIEIWYNNFQGVPAFHGNQHAELNANQVSTLFQDISGIAAASIVGFQFAHRGRAGIDTMAFTLTDLGINSVLGGGDDTTLFTQQYSDGNSAWGFYTGTGITALGNTVRFAFESVSAAGENDAIGNFLDAADFGVGVGVAAIPEPETYAMLLAGLGLLGFVARRRKQKEAA